MRASLSVAIIFATANAIELVAMEDYEFDLSVQTGIKPKPSGLSKYKKYQDTYWPEDRCCRIYTYTGYDIEQHNRNTDWADFCADAGDETPQVFYLNEYMKVYDEHNGKNTSAGYELWWNNRVNSFKCGTNVAIEFCDKESECGDYKQAESAAGGAESKEIGKINIHSYIKLTPYDPTLRFAATVFDKDSCNGWSHVVWIETGIDSGDLYSNVGNSLTSLGNDKIQSVMFPRKGDFWMDLWPEDKFEEDSCSQYTSWWDLRRHTCRDKQSRDSGDATDNGCVSHIPDIGVTSLRWGIGSKDDKCCRLYSQNSFEGSKRTYCLDGSQSATHDFSSSSFDNASYICGAKVRPSFYECTQTFPDGSCEVWSETGSAMHGSAYSAQSPRSDKLLLDPVTEPGATIYSQAGCKGSSFGMAMGQEESVAGDFFAAALIRAGVMSAWVPEESEVILNEDQLTEHKLRGTGQCIDFPASYAASTVKFGEIAIEN